MSNEMSLGPKSSIQILNILPDRLELISLYVRALPYQLQV